MKFTNLKRNVSAPAEPPGQPLGMNPALAEVREIINALRDSTTEMQSATTNLKSAAQAFEDTIRSMNKQEPATEVPAEAAQEVVSGQDQTPIDSS